jgi:hypothetical protein
MRPTSRTTVTVGALQSSSLGAGDVLAHVRTITCDECSRPIRWWNRRIWLLDRQCSAPDKRLFPGTQRLALKAAHLECWKGHLFFKALVAHQIRCSQLTADDEFPPTPQRRSRPSDNASADTGLRSPVAPMTALREPVEGLEAQQQQAELVAKTRVDKHQGSGNSSLRELGQGLRLSLARLAPHRPPLPPRLCMLCGGVEFSETSVVCSKCGTSLRPWS